MEVSSTQEIKKKIKKRKLFLKNGNIKTVEIFNNFSLKKSSNDLIENIIILKKSKCMSQLSITYLIISRKVTMYPLDPTLYSLH